MIKILRPSIRMSYLFSQILSPSIILLVLLGIPAFFSKAFAQSRIHYVTQNGSGNEKGDSWKNASKHLDKMIHESVSGDQIWVAGGTYSPIQQTNVFVMKKGVKMFGGFAGNEARLEDRDRTAFKNRSILDAKGAYKYISFFTQYTFQPIIHLIVEISLVITATSLLS